MLLIVRGLIGEDSENRFMEKSKDVLGRFGHRIRELRTARGYSQEEFAAKCGLDRTYISGIERGKRNVALRNIEAIAKALGMSLASIMEKV
jgi:transcriptional regulator with XRE-family HTH domain